MHSELFITNLQNEGFNTQGELSSFPLGKSDEEMVQRHRLDLWKRPCTHQAVKQLFGFARKLYSCKMECQS